ncbi:hypothetical protein [Bosea sp. RAC05]|uniref:hypothetical protein n=1 Tax=Bosea sp. RAC05 TaxID=1842539 RepID=UPI00083CFC8B|nr:hypothetical protein [Bosea sp. RAC05]AOG05126.1 hypothetical protein BSY19_1653 [Bosea sp. RAC05]
MIIFFILLGLGFVGGGAVAIVDGLPYMVLERGFTQVIIGTVVAVAGVILLALAWVLVEMKRLKCSLSNAAMAMSLASMASGATAAPDQATAKLQAAADGMGVAVPGLAAAGALAAAGIAVAQPAAPESPETPPEAPAHPDLFSAELSKVFAEPMPASPDDADTARARLDALPTFDPFQAMGQHSAPEPAVPAVSAEAEPAAILPPVPEQVPEAEAPADDAAIRADEDAAETQAQTASEPEPAATEGPEPAEAQAEMPAPPPVASDIDDPLTPDAPTVGLRDVRDDEFDRLRESLADLGLGTRPLGGRIEPSFEGAPGPVAGRLDDLAAASSWMEPALGRRANWPEPPEAPGLPPEREAAPADVSQPSWPVLDAADRPVPAWPPQTHSAPEPHLDEAEVPPAEPAAPAPTQPAEPEPAELPPAASDEGIVGAYQVGEAHFTIYADGSIQARTPDGDYSFASMDELKIYLASEKTRLGS